MSEEKHLWERLKYLDQLSNRQRPPEEQQEVKQILDRLRILRSLTSDSTSGDLTGTP